MDIAIKSISAPFSYKRPPVSSLSANLQRFGMEKVSKVESLQEIIEEMTEEDQHGCPSRRRFTMPHGIANGGNYDEKGL
jgi:hypothetical protein